MTALRKYKPIEHFLFPPTIFSENKLKKVLEGKTVLITGASYGIGEALTYQLAMSNVHLILVARTEEKLLTLKENAEKRGAKVSCYALDLQKEAAVFKLVEHLNELPDTIDIFINNAGKSIRRSIYDSLDRFHDFKRTMALNYFAPVQIGLGIIPLLLENKGHVINVSALNVLLPPASKWAAYQASKSAFDNWFRSVQPELNAKGVATTTIYLPLVRTRMIAPTKEYDKVPAMQPEHVAKKIAKAIINQRRKVAPWWLWFGQVSSVFLRRPWEYFSAHQQKTK